MGFYDIRLDPLISDGAQGFPDFEPVVIAGQENGEEKREGTKSKALGVWTISYNAKRPALWRGFQDHYYIVGGRLGSFPFKDPLDYTCSASEAYLLAIDSTHWQMCKRRTRGAYTYDQLIILPVLAATTVAGSGSYTVSRTTGIITKSSGSAPTGFVCTWFDKLCRFDGRIQQNIAAHKADGTMIVTCSGIALREIPLASA